MSDSKQLIGLKGGGFGIVGPEWDYCEIRHHAEVNLLHHCRVFLHENQQDDRWSDVDLCLGVESL